MHEVPRVTAQEFHHVRAELSNKGWSDHQINIAESMLHDSLVANPHLPSWKPGIDRESLNRHIDYMRSHQDVVHLGSHHLDQLSEALGRHI